MEEIVNRFQNAFKLLYEKLKGILLPPEGGAEGNRKGQTDDDDILMDDKPGKEIVIDNGAFQALSRKDLLNGLEWIFKRKMAMLTTKKGMLFDTSFNIYMNEDDYDDLEQSFGFTVKEAVNMFHEIIVKKIDQYPAYKPHASYWEFQFIPFKEGNILEGMGNEVVNIPRGKISIISFLLPTKGKDATVATGPQSATVTVCGKDSFTTSKMALNSDALKDITILSRDRFQVDFNNFRQIEADVLNDEQRQKSGQDARATITIKGAKFLLSSGHADAIYMNSDNLTISGRGGIADTTGGIPVVRIDSDKVMDNQLRLRYNPDSHKLYMMSQSEVRLHEKPVAAGEEKEVYNHSRILIVGDIQLEIINIKFD